MKKPLIISIISLIIAIIMSDIIFSNNNINVLASEQLPSSEIVIERDSGRVLFESNAQIKRPMASTTKIVTAITVIENSRLDEIVTVAKVAEGVEGSSIYLKAGEKLSVEALLYGLMLRSGNDAAVALACHVGKSVVGFVEMMNKTVQQIGALNSNFCNPHGLNDKEHFTTCYDLALITAYALKNETFSKIVSTKNITVENSDGEKRYFKNKNKMLSGFDGADGVKTGYTKVAGRCLVSSATRNGMQLICVVLGCAPMFERSSELLDSCFNNFKNKTILKKFEPIDKVEVGYKFLEKTYFYNCGLKSDFCYPLSVEETNELIFSTEKPNSLVYPLDNSKPIGKLNVFLRNKLIYSDNLYIIEDIKEMDYFDSLEGVSRNWELK